VDQLSQKKSWKGQASLKMKFEELKEAFNLFDTEATGKIYPRYMLLKYYYAKLRFNMIADLLSEG
jgi:Ca2+-binding EF-hand superfamily protein